VLGKVLSLSLSLSLSLELLIPRRRIINLELLVANTFLEVKGSIEKSRLRVTEAEKPREIWCYLSARISSCV
jgi:hypothetical protein